MQVNEILEDVPKGSVFEVIRYIRPDVTDKLPDNRYGITILYTMDYIAGEVVAKWSMCAGDQFSRKTGIEIARNPETPWVSFDIKLVDRLKGLNNALIYVLGFIYFGDESEYDVHPRYLSKHALFKMVREMV